jgi:histidinol-phosphate aminotransferase
MNATQTDAVRAGSKRCDTDGPTPALRTQGLRAYGGSTEAGRIDLALDANEGVAPSDLASMLRGVDRETLRRYPSVRGLETAFAAGWGVAADRVIVTAGADDALERICRAWLDPGRTAILTKPTFSMLWRYVAMNEGTRAEVEWMDGAFPTRNVIALGRDIDPAIVFIVSPNNPTGNVATWEDVRMISDAFPGAVVVLDQAYAEFADEDLTARALELNNVIVTRTLSKAYGLAGLRVGYAIGSEQLISPLRVVGHPYPVSGLSVAVATAAIAGDQGGMRSSVAQVIVERRRLGMFLHERGVWCVPSQANFVLGRFSGTAERVRHGLAERGISVRGFGDEPVLCDCLRITCPGNEGAYQRLLAALAEVMS